MKVLFAASEVAPWVKTGGLADVAQALPAALGRLGADVRVVTPAYPAMRKAAGEATVVAAFEVKGQPFRVLEATPGDGPTLWLVDHQGLFARPGTPYADAAGREFGDNAWRFGCYCESVVRLATGAAGWTPDIVHANDWHAGLVPVGLAAYAARPRSVFTIHNLAYQGRFGRNEFDALGLPPKFWHPGALEFHGGFSFLKGGLVFSDALTTVSPTYAQEIQTPAYGEGLDGVLRERSAALRGILNGIDTGAWDPARDRWLAARYDEGSVAEGKRANRRALQQAFALDADPDALLVGFVGRLAHQKGADLLHGTSDWFAQNGAQLALLGSGDAGLESRLTEWARAAAGRIAVKVAHDERLAHLVEAGADAFVMPSRYEPCGLNQMYSQRYGTVPVVRRTGGLADTVVDATSETLRDGSATGVAFEHPDDGGIRYGLGRALELFRRPEDWRALQAAGMRRDFSWDRSARNYLGLYASLG